jgi:hypothetical protein
MKRFLWTAAAGALVGALVAVWFSPGLIEWYFSPPANIGITCKEVVPWTIDAYRKVVLAGILIGGIFSSILFFAVGSRGKKKMADSAPGVGK